MGKRLIIKGADFSQNGITPPHTDIDWIGLSKSASKFISSGVALKNSSKFVIDFTTRAVDENFPVANGKGCYVGALLNNKKCIAVCVNASITSGTVAQALRIVYGKTNGESGFQYVKNILDGQRHSVEVSPSGYVVDGIPTEWPVNGNWGNSGDGSLPFYLDSCAFSSGASVSSDYFPTFPDTIKIHRVRIYDDATTLVFDATPVKKNDTNNTICYYDSISGAYFARNDGSTPCNSLDPTIDQPT